MMKGDEQVFWMIVLCLFGIVIGFFLADGGVVFDLGEIFSGMVVLVAAFSGAWFAFWLQSRNAQREVERVNLAAGNRVILLILSQANTLKQFQKEIIDPYRSSPVRALSMRPVPHFDEPGCLFDMVSLEFLIPEGRHDVLPDLIILEQKIKFAIKKINERSEFHRYKIQPRLSEAGFRHGENVELRVEDIVKAVTEFNWVILNVETDAMVVLVDDALERCIYLKNKMRDILNEKFADQFILDFEFSEKKSGP